MGARQSNRCSVYSIEWSTRYRFVLVECEIKVEKLVRLFKVSLHSSFKMWTNTILEYTTVMFMLIVLIPMALSNAFVNMDTKELPRFEAWFYVTRMPSSSMAEWLGYWTLNPAVPDSSPPPCHS